MQEGHDSRDRPISEFCLTTQKYLRDEIERFGLEVLTHECSIQLAALTIKPTLHERIRNAQADDEQLKRWVARDSEKGTNLYVTKEGITRFRDRLWVPTDDALRREILQEAHSAPYSVHPGSTKMYKDLQMHYWWPGMKGDVAKFVAQCLTCQQVKAEHQRPAGLLEPLPVPEWKWEKITMDFVVGLPVTKRGFDAVWVVVDRLTKSAHFIPIKTTYDSSRLAEIYIKEIIRLHGIPTTVVSDRDPRFTSAFWKNLQSALGTSLAFSTAFHPQTDGQSERVIQILEDMLRAATMDYPGSWDAKLPLVEFTYNNSYQKTIGMAPYEALYGRKCRSPLHWDEVGERIVLGPELVQQSAEVIKRVRERMMTAQSRQKSYADQRRRELEFNVGDHVFLKVAPMKGVVRFGKRGKLNPRYVGPFEILERIGTLAYRVALPPHLSSVHNVFHVSTLRKYVSDPSHVLNYETQNLAPDMSYEEKPIKIIQREERKLRKRAINMVKVQWANHTEREATWESEDNMRKRYPELFGK